MATMTRKQFVKGVTGVCLASWLPLSSRTSDAQAVAADGPLLIPYPAKPWAQATRLIGHRTKRDLEKLKGKTPSYGRLPLYNDFCLVKDQENHWHCVGILFEGTAAQDFSQDRLFHYVAESLQGPYRSAGYVDLGYGKGSGVWAPFILRDNHRVLMYYAIVGNDGPDNMSIRVAEALDPQLASWKRGVGGKEIMVLEPAARDPYIIRDHRTGLYLLYYVAEVQTAGVIRVRTSPDLLSWSAPRTVLGTPPDYAAAESVYVLQRAGYNYMWISSAADYGVMSLYISTDPFNFGDPVANRIEEQSGHGSEIVHSEGRDWMACVAIASVRGLDPPNAQHDVPIGQHDLEGVYIQPLEWRAATPQMVSKVIRAETV